MPEVADRVAFFTQAGSRFTTTTVRLNSEFYSRRESSKIIALFFNRMDVRECLSSRIAILNQEMSLSFPRHLSGIQRLLFFAAIDRAKDAGFPPEARGNDIMLLIFYRTLLVYNRTRLEIMLKWRV